MNGGAPVEQRVVTVGEYVVQVSGIEPFTLGRDRPAGPLPGSAPAGNRAGDSPTNAVTHLIFRELLLRSRSCVSVR